MDTQDMTFGAGRTHITEVIRSALWRAHGCGAAGQGLGPRLGAEMARDIVVQLADNGYSVERPTRGRAANVGEAIRTGDWNGVSDLDYAAWLAACRVADLALQPLTIAEADRIVEDGYTTHPRGEEAMDLLVADWTGKRPRTKDAA